MSGSWVGVGMAEPVRARRLTDEEGQRLTQEQRRAETERRVLDAAIALVARTGSPPSPWPRWGRLPGTAAGSCTTSSAAGSD
jgi:hypothetical protein